MFSRRERSWRELRTQPVLSGNAVLPAASTRLSVLTAATASTRDSGSLAILAANALHDSRPTFQNPPVIAWPYGSVRPAQLAQHVGPPPAQSSAPPALP